MGTFLTKGLFFETTLADKSSVVYTLKDDPHEGFPSLYRLYMETKDPTEWKFANAHLGGWRHWELLCESEWFKPYVERWRKELELAIKSEALARIMATGRSSSKEAFTANRFIVEKGWEPKEPQNKRGRPSKEEIRRAAEDHFVNARNLDEDFDRLFSKQVN
jgi:hypothetical protein